MTCSGPARDIMKNLFVAAVSAVLPEPLIASVIRYDGQRLVIGDLVFPLPKNKPVYVFGSGKATAGMIRAIHAVFGDQLAGGVGIDLVQEHRIGPVEILQGAHPVPDDKSFRSTKQLIAAMQKLQPDDFFIYLLSGGSSSMVEMPLPPVTQKDFQQMTDLLLHAGLPIREMNVFRKHLSAVKGGRLAQMIKAKGVVLVLSDVIGDHLSAIGSGLMYQDESTYAEVHHLLEQYSFLNRLPPNIIDAVMMGLNGLLPETPKKAREDLPHVIIGNNRKAILAAHQQAQSYKIPAVIMDEILCGEARDSAKGIIYRVREIAGNQKCSHQPVCFLFGGETTVTVTGNGKGGRNQEFCLAALDLIRDDPHMTVLSAGTDGIDGPTEAAGAMSDAQTFFKAQKMGLDIRDYLNRNDAYHFFDQTGDLLITGPTGTNVGDIAMVWVQPLS